MPPSNDNRLDEIRRAFHAVTPGPWSWFGNLKSKQIYLSSIGRGRQFVMSFRRWGMRDAQPEFRNTRDTMVPAEQWAREFADHNHSFSALGVPNAEFLAKSWEYVRDLIRMVDDRDEKIRDMQVLVEDAISVGEMEDADMTKEPWCSLYRAHEQALQ
jgi:hypothetical protein